EHVTVERHHIHADSEQRITGERELEHFLLARLERSRVLGLGRRSHRPEVVEPKLRISLDDELNVLAGWALQMNRPPTGSASLEKKTVRTRGGQCFDGSDHRTSPVADDDAWPLVRARHVYRKRRNRRVDREFEVGAAVGGEPFGRKQQLVLLVLYGSLRQPCGQSRVGTRVQVYDGRIRCPSEGFKAIVSGKPLVAEPVLLNASRCAGLAGQSRARTRID